MFSSNEMIPNCMPLFETKTKWLEMVGNDSNEGWREKETEREWNNDPREESLEAFTIHDIL